MKYIFVPLGSAGDVNPLTWLAQLMARRGHDVVVIDAIGASATGCYRNSFTPRRSLRSSTAFSIQTKRQRRAAK